MKDKYDKKTNYNKDFKKQIKKPVQEFNFKTSFVRDIRDGSVEKANVVGKINRIVQTGGPTVFIISKV